MCTQYKFAAFAFETLSIIVVQVIYKQLIHNCCLIIVVIILNVVYNYS